MKKFDLMITHANCMDGLGSALSLVKYAKDNKQEMPSIIFHNYGYGEPDIETFRDLNVIIADYSFSKEYMIDVNSIANSLVVLDHHVTAKDNLEGLDFCRFDMDKSGAVLTWEYLFPNETVPDVLKYIEDRDLWNWQLPQSKIVSAGLRLNSVIELYNVFANADMIDTFFSAQYLKDVTVRGDTVLTYQNSSVEFKTNPKKLSFKNIHGYVVPCINNNDLISEVGNTLAQKQSFSAQYFFTTDSIVFSFRSTDEGIDVSEIAKHFGGGGHRNAAGCSFRLNEFNFDKFFKEDILANNTFKGV